MKCSLKEFKKMLKTMVEDFIPDKDDEIDFKKPKIEVPTPPLNSYDAQETSTKVAFIQNGAVIEPKDEDDDIEDVVSAAKRSKKRDVYGLKSFTEIVKEDVSGINFSPPQGVRAACKRGLDLRKDYGGDGLTSAAVGWATKLAQGKPISPPKAKKMNAYFARHIVDKKPGWDSPPTPGYVAWMLWGGDAGKAWSAKLVKQINAKSNK